MAQTKTEVVEVQELTRYGFKNVQGEYVNWSKKIKESEKTPVVPGRTFNMELYIADSGKKYVNKVLSQVGTPSLKESPHLPASSQLETSSKILYHPPVNGPGKSTVSDAMTRADWDAKDRRISRQGVIQAAVQAVAAMSTQEDLFDNAESLANQMLEFVNK